MEQLDCSIAALEKQYIDFNNESLVNLDKKFRLSDDDITILALHFEITVIAFSYCAGIFSCVYF